MKTEEIIEKFYELANTSSGVSASAYRDCINLVISQPELLLDYNEIIARNIFKREREIGHFAQNNIHEIMYRLKKFYEILKKLKLRSGMGFEAVPFDVQKIIREAFDE